MDAGDAAGGTAGVDAAGGTAGVDAGDAAGGTAGADASDAAGGTSGNDASADTGADVSADTGADVAVDTGVDVAVDTGTDSGDAAVASPVVINEIESDLATDWIELYNTGSTTVDVSGWYILDNMETGQGRPDTFPSGTTIAAGAYLVRQYPASGFGFGGNDTVRLYNSSGTLVNSYAWTSHADGTYRRCPNGTGNFVPGSQATATEGTANTCP
jgi:hypothetical protein